MTEPGASEWTPGVAPCIGEGEVITVALDQLSPVRARRSPRGTVNPDPTVPESLVKTRTGARSSIRPEGTWGRAYRWGIAGGDLFLVAAVVAAALAASQRFDVVLAGGVAAGMAFTLLVGAMHGYDTRRAASGPHEYGVIVRAGWVWASLLVGALYFGAVQIQTRLVIITIVVSIGLVLLARSAQRAIVRSRRRRGQWQRRTLLIGDPDQLRHLAAQLQENSNYGFDVVGLCTAASAPGWLATPVLGDLARAADVIAEHRVRVVVVAANCMGAAELRRLCWQVEPYGVELIVAPNIEEVAPVRVALRPISGMPLLTVAIGPSRMQQVAKTAMDRSLGALLLLAALPVLTIAALSVRINSRGPAFYRQTRFGRDGSAFTMLKLRTMHVDADRRRAELLARSEGNDVMFKMRYDPRITSVGRVLRRFSVDELPQLWNVVRGDMSLVGPRPPLGEEVADYDYDAQQRLRVKPGLTGLWQVSGRSDLDWAQTVRLDLHYVDNWSVLMDMTILFRTFRAVFGGRGAY